MTDNKKTLVLYDSVEYFIKYMKSEEVDAFRIYKKRNFSLSILKQILLKVGIFCNLWYESWIHHLEIYDTIIIFGNKDYTFINEVKKRYPHIKIIFWYWNPIFRRGIPRTELYQLAEIWSFDPVDCKKYGFNFNTTFYFKEIFLDDVKSKYDCVFLGINKGRREFLNDLKVKLDQLDVINYFHIVPDKGEENPENVKPIAYAKYLQILSESKCIIDIMPQGQSGLTLRAMESIFLKKKLITNDLNIINEDFYDSNNIFVLGHDNLNEIKDFVVKSYKELDSAIVHKYDFSNWLKRFNKYE